MSSTVNPVATGAGGDRDYKSGVCVPSLPPHRNCRLVEKDRHTGAAAGSVPALRTAPTRVSWCLLHVVAAQTAVGDNFRAYAWLAQPCLSMESWRTASTALHDACPGHAPNRPLRSNMRARCTATASHPITEMHVATCPLHGCGSRTSQRTRGGFNAGRGSWSSGGRSGGRFCKATAAGCCGTGPSETVTSARAASGSADTWIFTPPRRSTREGASLLGPECQGVCMRNHTVCADTRAWLQDEVGISTARCHGERLLVSVRTPRFYPVPCVPWGGTRCCATG